MKYLVSVTLLGLSFLAAFGIANAIDSTVPVPFKRFDSSSTKIINYDVLTLWLKSVVVDIGRSDREKADLTQPGIGTRIKPKFNRSTIYEGNRFYYEAFQNNPEARQVLRDIRNSLEQIPGKIPLEYFSRDEQLAYWLNLYNVTILNEIVAIYPKRDLENFLAGENSILSKKLLTVAGISLSLNDIQFTILNQNYDNNPLIMYGLYQGNVGGPNIRRSAYTGADVYRALTNNAIEFVNSNRGTNRDRDKNRVLKVSSLYERNRIYFPDFNADLSAHLQKYFEGNERSLANSKTILEPVLHDWTVTDLYGSYPEIRNGIATNPAALMGAIVSTSPGDPINGGGTTLGAAVAYGASAYLSKASGMRQYSPEVFEHLLILNMKRVETNRKNGTVTMEELGEFPVEPTDGVELKD